MDPNSGADTFVFSKTKRDNFSRPLRFISCKPVNLDGLMNVSRSQIRQIGILNDKK